MANENDPIFGVILKHFTDNPTSIEAKFGGDPKKAAEAYFATQAYATQLAQENARLKAAQNPAPAPAAPTTGLVLNEPPKVSTEQAWTTVVNALETNGGTVTPDIQTLATNGGLPSAALTTVAENIRTRLASQSVEAAALVGGQEKLQALLKWQETNLSPEERTAVNSAMRSPAWRTTLAGLAARMNQASPLKGETGSLPSVASPNGGSDSAPFASTNEQLVAMSDPRYRTDPVYRASVEKRTRATAKAWT